MKKLRIAVIGCGRIAAVYAPAFRHLSEAEGIDLVLAVVSRVRRLGRGEL